MMLIETPCFCRFVGIDLGLPESRDFVSLCQVSGLCETIKRLLPPYLWMGGDHCQKS